MHKRGYLSSIKGQSASVDVRRVSGRVLLQGELYDVATGARLWSERITGRSSNTAVGGTAVTGDTARRLAHFFGTSAEFWLNL